MSQFIYIIYNVLTFIIKPLLFILIKYRILIHKEDPKRYKEKFGIYEIKRPIGKLIWIHAASVGETNSIITLIKELSNKNNNVTILMTTVTITSAKIIQDKILPISSNIIHQFVPFDCLLFVKRFLNYWQPTVSVFVESELWPNLLLETKKISQKVFLINGRLSDRSFRRWKMFGKVILNKFIIPSFDIIYTGTPFDKEKYAQLGFNNTEYIGNLKYDIDLKIDDQLKQIFNKNINNKKILIAASIRTGEDEIILNAFKNIIKKHNILLIFTPRHKRMEVIEPMLREMNFNYIKRSDNVYPDENTNIFLLDTVGELMNFYNISNIAIVGGTFVKDKGGHNPIEPLSLGKTTIIGPYYRNLVNIAEDMKANKIIYCIESKHHLVAELTTKLDHLLTQGKDEQMIQNIKKFLSQRRGASQIIANKILQIFE